MPSTSALEEEGRCLIHVVYIKDTLAAAPNVAGTPQLSCSAPVAFSYFFFFSSF
jgi:hypothetical protein